MNPKPDTCKPCPLYTLGEGFMPKPEWHPTSRVLLVGEALGEEEAKSGTPFKGRAGLAMAQTLARDGMLREFFGFENTLRCRPPKNKLIGEPYESEAIVTCRQYSDASIASLRPKVIVALGSTALNRLHHLPPRTLSIEKCRGYWEFSTTYNAWLGATYHPAYLMRGNWKLTPIFLHDIRTALKIEQEGYAYDEIVVLEDPLPSEFLGWVSQALQRPDLDLDIETPYKQKGEEDTLETLNVEPIIRISFKAEGLPSVSVPFTAPYIGGINQLLTSAQVKWIWNKAFDKRKLRDAGYPLGGETRDAMYAWHALHSDLPKKLETVSSLLIPGLRRWKHLSNERPAYYSGVDSEVLHRNRVSTVRQLHVAGLWPFYQRHVLDLEPSLEMMSDRGLLVDAGRRQEAATWLEHRLDETQRAMEEVLPAALRQYEPKAGYVRDPEDTREMVRIQVQAKVKVCSACGAVGVTKTGHTSRKTIASGDGSRRPNPCHSAPIEERLRTVERWARRDWFTPSNKRMTGYAQFHKHKLVLKIEKGDQAEDGRPTFNEEAVREMMRNYPKDPLYPLILQYRGFEKLIGYTGTWDARTSTFVGGWPVWKDNCLHPVFNSNPSTFRLASSEPNVNQIPRPESEGARMVRRCVVAPPGMRFVELDFSGIEAVLVGYFAKSERYVRLCRLGIHDFVNIHNLIRLGMWEEPPQLSWSDGDLKAMFKESKARFPEHRQAAKKTVHCLTGDHEVLTPQGWMRLDALTYGIPIAQWSHSGHVTWTLPSEVIHSAYEGPMHRVTGPSFDMMGTPNHEVVWHTGWKTPHHRSRLDELPERGRIPQVGFMDGNRQWSGWLQLAIAIQADGYLSPDGELTFHFRRLRKVRRLLKVLRGLGVKHSAFKAADCIVVRTRQRHVEQALEWLGPDKTFIWTRFLDLTLEAKRQVLAEVLHWDGGSYTHPHTGRVRVEYRTQNESNARLVQTLAHVCGQQSKVTQDSSGVWRVSQNRRVSARLECMTRDVVPYSGQIHCVTVPTGMFLYRYHGKIAVSHNSGNYGITPKGLFLREPDIYGSIENAKALLTLYFDLFPELKVWQESTIEEAAKNRYLNTVWGNRHWFWRAKSWRKTKGGEWAGKWGEEAERVLAMRPQSTAAGILKEAILNLKAEHREVHDRLVLPNHDALLAVCADTDEALSDTFNAMRAIMERPIDRLPLPWNPSENLRIGIEGKWGYDWADMQEVH